MGVKMFYDYEVVNSIHKLSEEGGKVKNEIFKSSMMKREIYDDVMRNFISYINGLLKTWDDHCQQLELEMNKSSGREGVRTLDYAFAKDYIYAEYDYAAVLQFADGVENGLTSGKFKEPADIEKFFSHCVEKAFDDQPDTVAGLLETSLQQHTQTTSGVTSDTYQAKMYDTIKNYKKICDPRNRVELYKAIVKTIDFLRNDFNVNKSFDYNNMRMFISAVNNIIDFVIYSITAFVTRVYIISQYAGPYIRSEVVHSYKESSSIESINITTMRDMDDSLSRDYTKAEKLIGTLCKFVTDVGADGLFDGKPDYGSHIGGEEANNKSMFCNKLIGNPLMDFFNNKYGYFPYARETPTSISTTSETLKSFAYNQYQGISGMTTAKQEMMHVIRGVGNDAKTPKELQEVTKGLYVMSIRVCRAMVDMINDLFMWKKNDASTHNLADINKVSECIKVLGELYRDIMSAIVEKARDIETKYNAMSSNEMEKINSDISIKVPGGLDRLKDDTNSISNIVPDTARMPIELMDMYALPAFESAQMYDDFLRTLPEFEDSTYLNESVGDIFNALLALLAGIRKKVDAFFMNKATKDAMEWVKNHKNELDAITFKDGDMMDKTLMFKENISLPKGYEKLINGIKGFTEKNAESAEAVSAFIKGLYPSDTVYNWFTSEATKDKAAKMYLAALLYKSVEEVNAGQITAVPTGTIKGAEFQRQFKMWVETVSNGPAVYESYKKLDDELTNNIKSIKNKIVQMETNKPKENTQTTQPTNATQNNDKKTEADKNAESTEKKASETEVKVGDNKQGTTSPSGNVMNEITLTVNRLWEPIGKMICTAIKTQYKYIKDVYTAKKNQQASNK